MRSVCPITHQGRVVAIVVDGHAVINAGLTGEAHRLVAAKCLYALELSAGQRRGPYRDDDAVRYAHVLIRMASAGGGPPD